MSGLKTSIAARRGVANGAGASPQLRQPRPARPSLGNGKLVLRPAAASRGSSPRHRFIEGKTPGGGMFCG